MPENRPLSSQRLCARVPCQESRISADSGTSFLEQPLGATRSTTECIALPWMPAFRGACPKTVGIAG